jgi:uncharacterized protein YutD
MPLKKNLFLSVCHLEKKVDYKRNYNFAYCLFGCENSFFTLTEEHRLKSFREKGAEKELRV